MNDDAKMIADPGSWPCWPLLPLKRRDRSLAHGNLGVLIDGQGLTVYHAYLFGPVPDDCPKTAYHTVAALLADGWRVD